VKLPFSMDVLLWRSWLPLIRLADCDEAMVAALVESGPDAKQSEYYLTLVHDAPALIARSRLFNAIMYGRRGLPRAERELAATAESRANGCVFCASVHSRLYAKLSKDSETMHRLLEHGPGAAMSARSRAIVDYAIRLGASPPTAGEADISALRAVGLSEGEIMDTTHAIAIFAWANRLMLSLGEPEPDTADAISTAPAISMARTNLTG
jgi:uncharacterized peroxidase-related enzyme